MSADICLASLQMCLLDSEQRDTNGKQMATGSAEEMKWMQKILLPLLLQPGRAMLIALSAHHSTNSMLKA